MAQPVSFEGQNVVYTHPDCSDLPVCQRATLLGTEPATEVISAWQLTPEELAAVNESGGIVFLGVIGGQPPVWITGINPINS